MDQKLWDDLRSNPENAKSSIQVAAEQREQERLRSLQNIKVKPTPAAREAAAAKFAAIKAMNAAEKATAAVEVVNQREREIQTLLVAALEVASPAETTQVMATITPSMLRGMVLRSTDYNIVEYVNAELMRIRAVKELEL
jgi:hypothetical protein